MESELPETGEICAKPTTFWNSNRPPARANPRNWHRPVTPGVAGSSPVHSANNSFDDKDLAAFGRLFHIPKISVFGICATKRLCRSRAWRCEYRPRPSQTRERDRLSPSQALDAMRLKRSRTLICSPVTDAATEEASSTAVASVELTADCLGANRNLSNDSTWDC